MELTSKFWIFKKKLSSSENEVILLKNPDIVVNSEKIYSDVRKFEERLFSDDVTKNLPKLNRNSPYYQEWKIRNILLDNLMVQIKIAGNSKIILDVGCGTGWLGNLISNKLGNYVIGIDTNYNELLQGRRIFSENKKIDFVYGNILKEKIKSKSVDIIIFNASIQHFNNFHFIIDKLIESLKNNGEIYILDSIFYLNKNLKSAKNNTLKYYSKLGFPEMIEHYFHHSLEDLKKFRYKIIYNPNIIYRKVLRKFLPFIFSPFYFVKIFN
ncbi:MAG: Ubiquinone/menaquinone biosynthesis C-methyltransferase UbiE [Candidatus Heimdallarchaeota archaeon LC_3]|nr:MAG: Ubiquinone/menaquinone biosynthesis C-methyltransferase UbiE [Candidatus Heimdallarchaeota archaeon LC_3]